MLPELGRIGPVTIRTYALLLNLAIISGLGTLLWYGQQADQRPARWVDAGLAGVVLGMVFGRLGHVALYWHYFSEHQTEIMQIWRGGLDWHAAVLGGLLGVGVMASLRGVPHRELYDLLAMVAPVGVTLIYAGCLSTSCGHGAEVQALDQYPPWAVAELPDLFGVVAPRFATQLYGVVLGIVLLIAAVITSILIKRDGLRLWIVLILLGAGAFAIGFWRGDSIFMLGVLRFDQILDLLIVGVGIVGLIVCIARLPTPLQELLPDIRSMETLRAD